jgi:hypothetical protein
MVAMQLGRAPAIEFIIEVECPYGWPAVILNQPFTKEGKPNPNILYLTCPYLRHEMAVLEDAGLISKLESRLREEPDLDADLEKAQRGHRQLWRRRAREAGGDKGPIITPPNIAAAGKTHRIKCLHAHMAWYLTHPDYEIGDIIMRELPDPWCEDERCERLTRGK